MRNTKIQELGAMVIMLLSTVGVVILFSLMMSSCNYNDEPVTMEERAQIEAEGYVLKFLKSPKTAQFEDADVWAMGGAIYTVSGSFDCENGFGALLRARYTVDVEFLPNNMVRFSKLEIID